MLLQKRFTKKFFWTHFCLIVPILLVSILMFYMIAREMRVIEEEKLQEQLENAVMGVAALYSNYREESVLLSVSSELLPYRIDASQQQTAEGIAVLRMKRYFDSRIKDVFLYKGTDYIYSSMGKSSNKVHFTKILSCREESWQRGMALIESGENGIIFLYETDTRGYMMYSYATRKVKDEYVSINFLVSTEEIMEMFCPSGKNQWYQLEAGDGSRVIFGYSDSGKWSILSEEEWIGRMDSGRYSVIEKNLEQAELTVRLYYEQLTFDMSDGLYRLQLINMVLIIAAILLSALASWVLSKHRVKEIEHLEKIVGGDSDYSFPMNNVYSSLENMIVMQLGETRKLEERAQERENQLMAKTAHMVFHGMIQPSELNAVFQELGFKGVPDGFFVCVVSTEEPYGEAKLPTLLKNCMRTHVAHEDWEARAFLCELRMSDHNKVQRKELAGEIRRQLHQQDIRKVRIGMSQVYEEPRMIDCAYNEAVRTLEYVLSGKSQDYCGCWEDVVQEAGIFMPENAVLQKFEESLTEKDFEEAKRLFYHMLNGCAVKECSDENRHYVRYTILHCVVEYLNATDTAEKIVLLRECLNIDIKDEKRYTQAMVNILKRCLMKKEDDKFSRILDYIENNYHRSDLTYEEVAVAGGIGKTYVSKMFRSQLGVSYIEYLTMVRMDRAATLLRTTDISINDIVKMVGYENASSFRRCFKDRYGINAADYRKKEQWLNEGE